MLLRIEDFVSQRLENLCTEKDISRYELSQKTGVSQNALSKIVKSKQLPKLDTLERICEGFSISIAEFFRTPKDLIGISDEQAQILEYIECLSPDEKRFLKIVLKDLIETKSSGK